MPIAVELLEVLVCPECKGGLDSREESDSLYCSVCSRFYPIRQGIPVLLIEESFKEVEKDSKEVQLQKEGDAVFRITSGLNQGVDFSLLEGSCCLIGRNAEDLNKTQIVAIDAAVPLDDFTKKLVLNYLSKKIGKVLPDEEKKEGKVGGMDRLPDLLLQDQSVSRLHALLFYDETGVGVLDLVSRNGTYVNGQEVESRLLQSGDLIEIGGTKILFTIQKGKVE